MKSQAGESAAVLIADDHPEENARFYRHTGCEQMLAFGGMLADTTWIVPLDDCPLPDHSECPECCRWLPVQRGEIVR